MVCITKKKTKQQHTCRRRPAIELSIQLEKKREKGEKKERKKEWAATGARTRMALSLSLSINLETRPYIYLHLHKRDPSSVGEENGIGFTFHLDWILRLTWPLSRQANTVHWFVIHR